MKKLIYVPKKIYLWILSVFIILISLVFLGLAFKVEKTFSANIFVPEYSNKKIQISQNNLYKIKEGQKIVLHFNQNNYYCYIKEIEYDSETNKFNLIIEGLNIELIEGMNLQVTIVYDEEPWIYSMFN